MAGRAVPPFGGQSLPWDTEKSPSLMGFRYREFRDPTLVQA